MHVPIVTFLSNRKKAIAKHTSIKESMFNVCFSSKSVAEPIYKAKKWFIRSYVDLQSQDELHHPTPLKIKAHFTNIPKEKPYE